MKVKTIENLNLTSELLKELINEVESIEELEKVESRILRKLNRLVEDKKNLLESREISLIDFIRLVSNSFTLNSELLEDTKEYFIYKVEFQKIQDFEIMEYLKVMKNF